MPIPIVTIPDKGKIATRPRRQAVWDSEGDPSGSAIPTKLTFHRSYTAFQATGLTLTKVKGRDTSQEGAPGQIPTGDVFHWYAITLPTFIRNEGFLNPITAAAVASANVTARLTIMQIKRLRVARGFIFRFSNTPYIQAQQDEIPAGAGVIESTMSGFPALASVGPSTGTVNLMYNTGDSTSNSRAERLGRYDVCIDGFPTTITEQENFAADLVADSGLVPTPSLDIYHTLFLLGTYLMGIRG
jgi:hypothetical protein